MLDNDFDSRAVNCTYLDSVLDSEYCFTDQTIILPIGTGKVKRNTFHTSTYRIKKKCLMSSLGK